MVLGGGYEKIQDTVTISTPESLIGHTFEFVAISVELAMKSTCTF
jgi:hypothetical protein